MACCTGSEIDLKEMKTGGQKQMGNILGPLISAGISSGATPFGGQLSAGPDQAQMSAMNMMMGIGGQGQYQPNPYPMMGAQGRPPGPITPWNYDSDGGGGSNYDGDVITPPMLRDPNKPIHNITPGRLRDPGYRNPVPPGSSRNTGGTQPLIFDVLRGLFGGNRVRP